MYILSGENMSLSFQANSVAGQANDYPIMVINYGNSIEFFLLFWKIKREEEKEEREKERALCRFEEGKDRSHVTTQC